MGYDTRRKSLYLPDLGIELPQTHASKAAARLSPLSTRSTTTMTTTNTPTPNHSFAKKIKRSHRDSCAWLPIPKRVQIKYEHFSRPPSPPPEVDEIKIEDDDDRVDDVDVDHVVKHLKVEDVKCKEIDLMGINDEIVEGVIVQLQKTGNRPHLVKELAAILSRTVKIVALSANPSAIISSRLSTYLKRSWSRASPCPVGKELETVHPRRTYFYLTTYPHQPIPDLSHVPPRATHSPSISGAESTDGPLEERDRSPSPEVDLSSEEYEDDDAMTPPTPSGSFSGRLEPPFRPARASSVGLEKDEKEFTQTARGLQKRPFGAAPASLATPSDLTDMPSHLADTPTKSDADPFFGEGRPFSLPHSALVGAASPVVGAWDWDLRSPEHIALEELDGMLDDF